MTKGFTLVELLAVIVILAVLALIATPVVLSIIDDAKESAMLRSAEMYLSGVENAVMRENMNSGGNFRPNECTITSEGNIYCDENEKIIEVEVNGEKPNNGTISFENGKIKEVILNYTSGIIVKNEEGNLVYEGSDSNLTYESLGNYEHQHQDGTIEVHDTENGICSKCGENVLAPGLYDENDVMTMSWEELTRKDKDFNNNCCIEADAILSVDENGILHSAVLNSRGEQETCCMESLSLEYLVGKLVLDSSVTKIGVWAFIGCKNLTSVVIPNTVEMIESGAFWSCSELKSIELPNSLTYIDGFAFLNCSNLTSITLPNSVTYIGDSAFLNCSNLTSITLSNSLTYIGGSAFQSCTSLTSIYIPSNVTTIIAGNAYSGDYIIDLPFGDCSPSLIIYCGATSKPSDWRNYWNCYDKKDLSKQLSVEWGITREQYNDIIN